MGKINILIVDDIKDNIYSLRQLIEDNFNFNCYEAVSVIDALNILMEKDINIIFSAIQMPEIDGFEFINYLKDIPVILVSGICLSQENKNYLSNYKNITFLAKPIDTSELILAINKYI